MMVCINGYCGRGERNIRPKTRRINTGDLAMLKDDRQEMISTGFQVRSILLEAAYEGQRSDKPKI